MKKQLLLLPMGLLSLGMAWGQQADQKMLPSGTGGMNQSMGNLSSPNLFDGSTNINIPIHSFGNFGVSLSYSTKGVPVEEISGPAGTHWVLNAGGSITRNVRDIPDEANETFDPTPTVADLPYTLMGRAHTYHATGTQQARDYRDGENDEFMVSAGPLQFTFMLGKDGYVFTYPENRYKIKPIAAAGTSPDDIYIFEKFEITDDQGTTYSFGTRAGLMRGSITFGNTEPGASYNGDVRAFYYTPKWFLDKVTFANGQHITFSYEQMDYPADGMPPLEGLSLYRPRTLTHKPSGPVNDADPGPVFMAAQQDYTQNLTGIQYPDNSSVQFVFDQGAGAQPFCMKSINQIVIQQGDNCMKYRLNKAYLEQDNNNYLLAKEVPFDNNCNYNPEQGVSRRMILKGIDILSCDENKVQPYYAFEYSNVSPPSRWGNNRDFFGYCNGIANNNTNANNPSAGNSYMLQPTITKTPFDNSYGPHPECNRCVATDVSPMTALSLRKVKNAYGGSVTFEYELHTGLVSVTDNLPGMSALLNGNLASHLFTGRNAADGLRLRRTIAEDKYRPGSKLITEYTYEGGQLFLNGGYYAYPTIKDANGAITQYKATSGWVSPHQLINGSNHGYSKVTVTTRDNSNNQLSKTINYFSNFKEGNTLHYWANNPSGSAKNYYEWPCTDKQYIKDWKLGLLLKAETFDQNNYITSRTTNVYNTEMADDYTSAEAWLGINVHTMRIAYTGPGSGNAQIMDPMYDFAKDYYVPYRGQAFLISTKTEKFTSNTNAVTDIADYKYETVRRNLSEVKTRNSRNEYFLTRNIYNYEVTGVAAFDAMTNAGMEKVIATERWKIGSSSPSGDALYEAGITGFTYENGILATKKVWTLRSLQPVPYNTYTNSGAARYGRIQAAYNSPAQPPAGFELISEAMQYDANRNPVETKLGNQDDYQAMIWDVNYNKGATANARLKDIGFTSFEPNPAGNANANTEVTDGRFTYKFVGVQGIAGSVSGGRIYNLSPATYIKSPVLTAGQAYEMTVWSNGAAPQVSGAGVTLDFIPAYENSNWKCYRALFTPATDGILNFYSPSSIKVDEIRLFPAGATMTNAVYAPLLGPTSSTDATGRITYYEYDALGRQHLTRDQEGNILSKKDYHLAQ